MAVGIYLKQRLNLDAIGLVDSINRATIFIDSGRKGFAIRGKAEKGRISYEDGIAEAMTAFQEAQSSSDPQTIILAEYTFISQELQLCDKADKDSINSLSKAIQFFDDAFLALKAVESNMYQVVDNAIPHDKKYRVNDLPKDAFHIACLSHKTRIKNILRFSGIDPIEKALLKQRFINLSAGQGGYIEKQKKALRDK
jgi:hypothetical protein